jgi:hypothetical protein
MINVLVILFYCKLIITGIYLFKFLTDIFSPIVFQDKNENVGKDLKQFVNEKKLLKEKDRACQI